MLQNFHLFGNDLAIQYTVVTSIETRVTKTLGETFVSSVQFSCSVVSDSVTPCGTPGLPFHHQLLEFTQTPVHWVTDAIQTSHPLLSSSCPQSFPIRVFSNESALCIRWPKYWSFSFNISPSNEHPGLISFRREKSLEYPKLLPLADA